MHSFCNIVHTKDVGTPLQGRHMEGLGGRKGLLRSSTKKAVYHALAGHPDKDFARAHPGLYFLQAVQQGVILLQSLGKSEARIDNPVIYAMNFRLFREISEIFQDLFHNIVLICKRLHVFRHASHMHRNVFQPQTADRRKHPGISFSGRDVIDYERPHKYESLLDDRCPIRIYR